MEKYNRNLMIEQLDRKLAKLRVLQEIEAPSKGWINAIRTTLNISLVQLARRLKKTSASLKEIEEREQNKTITLNKLIEVGEALDLQFVYGFLPKESSIEKMIDKRAQRVARDIVMRTSHSMKLEEQENSDKRLLRAIKDRAEILKQEMPNHLWD
jgi:predicted DNA-binding mobile mystery protein A